MQGMMGAGGWLSSTRPQGMSEMPHEDGTGMLALGTGTAQVDGLTLRALPVIHLLMWNIRLVMCRHPGVPACPMYLPTPDWSLHCRSPGCLASPLGAC